MLVNKFIYSMGFNMKLFSHLLLISFSLLLSGCFESSKNTDKLCQDNPELRCDNMNINDGQCRLPRTNLIWHRREVLKNPTSENKIKEYELLHTYQQCLELASQIQVIDQTELQQKRFSALMNTHTDQANIVADLEKISSPSVYYFLWTQFDNSEAKRNFLKLEGTKELETAELQYALATYYTTRDKRKTVLLLEHALELSDPTNLNIEIFTSLASVNQSLGNKEHAYIWAIVSKDFGINLISDADMQRMFIFNEDKIKRLQEIANTIIKAIKKGQYRQDLLPTIKELK